MKEEIKLMKGNEAIAHAAIRYGADGYFGYPITPQSEILETLEELMPWDTTGIHTKSSITPDDPKRFDLPIPEDHRSHIDIVFKHLHQ